MAELKQAAAAPDQAAQAAQAANDKNKDKPYIQIEGITKSFDGVIAVDNVTLDIQEGELFGLLGGSGCGKSTLLRMLAGFEIPTAGRIFIDGEAMEGIEPYRRPTNMMFQSYALFPHMTVAQNIAFGLKQDDISKEEVNSRVDEMLELVQMTSYAKRTPHQLSGGQQQRVALARSLSKHPKLLLLDEPMGALDKKLRTEMQLEVANIIERVGVTCIMVTHDQEEAMTMAGRVAVMDAGLMQQIGTPTDIYEYPNSRATAEFIGSINIFDGKVTEDKADHVTVTSPELSTPLYVNHGISCADNASVAVAVRPEKILLTRKKPTEKHNWTQGVIHDFAYLGSHTVYHVKTPKGKIVQVNQPNLSRDSSQRPKWKEEVFLSWEADSAVVLTS